VHVRLQNLRQLIYTGHQNPAQQRRAREAFEQEMDDMANDESRFVSVRAAQLRSAARRRPYVDVPTEDRDRDTTTLASPLPSAPTPSNAGVSPSSLVRSRRRAFRPSERLTRNQRERLGQSATSYTPSRSSPLPETPDPAAHRDYRSRAKRRKLDDGSYDDEPKAMVYGYKGQVVPGQLKLEIANCDGEYQDPHGSNTSWPQNVLQDDNLAYCTKGDRCNMVLKHSGGMPFTLTKVVIKVPRSDCAAPVQEGMIFIAMDDATILDKTSRYETHYTPRSCRFGRSQHEHPRASRGYLNSTRSPLRSISRSHVSNPPVMPEPRERDHMLDCAVIPGFRVTAGEPSDDEDTVPSGPSSPRRWQQSEVEDSFRQPYIDRYRPRYAEQANPVEPAYDESNQSSDSESQSDPLDDPNTIAAVLSELGEQSDSEARRFARTLRRNMEATTRRNIAERNRAQAQAQADLEDDDTDSDDSRSPNHYSDRRAMSSRANLRPYGNPEIPRPPGYQRLGSEPAAEVERKNVTDNDVHSGTGNSNAVASSSDTVPPHARFFFAHKRSVAIKFDPPV
jgi:hypothetical protein